MFAMPLTVMLTGQEHSAIQAHMQAYIQCIEANLSRQQMCVQGDVLPEAPAWQLPAHATRPAYDLSAICQAAERLQQPRQPASCGAGWLASLLPLWL